MKLIDSQLEASLNHMSVFLSANKAASVCNVAEQPLTDGDDEFLWTKRAERLIHGFIYSAGSD